MSFINYLTKIIFLSLLFFGPLDYSWPAWFAVRIAYLILIPILFRLLLKWTWGYFKPSLKFENSLHLLLSGIIVIVFLFIAYQEVSSTSHIGSLYSRLTRDGHETFGPDILITGPNRLNVFFSILIALLVLWFGIIKRINNNSESKNLNQDEFND